MAFTDGTMGTFRDFLSRIGANTGTPNTFYHRLLTVHILEMEDVLFHLDSAVMMPAKPEGRSSSDGTTDDSTDAGTQQQQDQVSGLAALALCFKQFEFDPNKRLLIAGHTDTSGQAQMNFELSAQRAQNIQFLLEGDREQWAVISEQRHRVEDYQQIMQFINFNTRWGWDCDPIQTDNTWGDNTKGATERFITAYNNWVLSGLAPTDSVQLPPETFNRVKNSGAHKWPIEMWRAVYDIYNDEIAANLGITRDQMGRYRALLAFADDLKKLVACGESFPLDNAGRDNYRSQLNRRVELLFFDKEEIPVLNCPATTNAVHTPDECPLWHKWHFAPVYIDPADLNAVAYHLKFVYYDKIAKAIKDIPDGLPIKVFENGTTEIPARMTYSNGVYTVKVQDNPARTDLHFNFAMVNSFIFTENDAATPVIVAKTPGEVNAMPFAERRKYYDLPEKWSSINYWTRYQTDLDVGDRFKEVLRTHRSLKPFGGNFSDPNTPLTFSLDDIVLLDAVGGAQDIKDADHSLPPVAKNLSARSRVKIMVIDPADGFLKLHKRGADAKSARIPFEKNLIVEKLEDVKTAAIVHFRDGFYPIGSRRTIESANWESNGFVVGARAALRDDPNYMRSFDMGGTSANREFSFSGDYQFFYFHHLHMEDQHPISYTITYIAISFMIDSRAAGPNTNPIPTAADVLKFVDEGCYNAMDRWNMIQFYLDEATPTATSERIKPFYLYDERETFVIPQASTPTNIDFDTESNSEALFQHPAVTAARRNALGGKSRFLACICRDDPGSQYGRAYQHQRRLWGRTYSFFMMNKSAYHDVGSVLGVGSTVTELGQTFGVFTLAHEIGHAVGLPDEYFYQEFVIEYDDAAGHHRRIFGSYRRDFECYSMPANASSMMKGNVAPRNHHLWYTLYKVNFETASANWTAFHPAARRFVVKLVRGGQDLTFHRGNLTISGSQRRMTLGSHTLNNDFALPQAIDEHHSIPGATDKQVRLSLFHIGQDLSSRRGLHLNQNDFEYQAVLTIAVMLKVEFTDDDDDWTGAEKAAKIAGFQAAWLNWGGKYRLVGGTRGIERIFLHFVPGFTDQDEDQTNYITQFQHSNADAGDPKVFIHNPLIGSNKLRIKMNATARETVQFLLDMSTGQDELAVLDFVRVWVNGQLSDTFTLERI
ncbi:MAG: hypothetical protein WBP42_04475 [Candidatus Zixiibacteriota bacterium]